jgi:NAD(P)H-flavin reductase
MPSTFPSTIATTTTSLFVDFTPTTITSLTKLTDDVISLTLPYSDACRDESSFTSPGQYIQLKTPLDNKISYLAIANSPTNAEQSNALAFIIKRSPTSAGLFYSVDRREEREEDRRREREERIVVAEADAEEDGVAPVFADDEDEASEDDFLEDFLEDTRAIAVEVSPVLGKGFPIHEMLTDSVDPSCGKTDLSSVVLMATGTGIAPIISLLEEDTLGLMKVNVTAANELPAAAMSKLPRSAASARKGYLYLGCKSEDEQLISLDTIKEWRDKYNLDVKLCHSNNPDHKRVQKELQDDAQYVLKRPRKCGIIVCGPKELYEDVKLIGKKVGMIDARIISNF